MSVVAFPAVKVHIFFNISFPIIQMCSLFFLMFYASHISKIHVDVGAHSDVPYASMLKTPVLYPKSAFCYDHLLLRTVKCFELRAFRNSVE